MGFEMNIFSKKSFLFIGSVYSLLIISLFSHADENHVAMNAIRLSESVYMIMGNGGNLGVSIGEDGTFLIDDQFAPSTENILKEIEAIDGEAPRFIINTHWHHDHTGGNENMGKGGAVIVAHDNVRKRLMSDGFIPQFIKKTKPFSKEGLPTITYAEGISFHLNKDTIEVIHFPNAHTDGDSIVYFTNDNILHAGDLFFNGFYPFIDTHNGGSLKGMINAVGSVLELMNDQTQIIPGHGPLAKKPDLRRYHEMLIFAYDSLKALKKQGKTLGEVLALKPLKSLDDKWSKGLFPTDKWITNIYNGLD